jgi:hypothetical protein
MRRIPPLVLALFTANVVLILLPVIDHAAGSPFSKLRNFFYLDAETTLQAWYSSMQWFLAASLFGVFALYAYRSRLSGMLAMVAFAGLCLAFSIDEIAGIHEWLGERSDALLPGGDRANSIFARTGIWPLLIGVPMLAALAVLTLRARRIFLPRAPLAFWLLAIGLATMFTGALAIELLVNLLDKPADASEYGTVHLLQHATEEFLEMLGVSLIIWSGLELLRTYGFALQTPAPAADATRARDPRRSPVTETPYVAT